MYNKLTAKYKCNNVPALVIEWILTYFPKDFKETVVEYSFSAAIHLKLWIISHVCALAKLLQWWPLFLIVFTTYLIFMFMCIPLVRCLFFFSFLLISFAITSHCFQLLPTERVRGPTQWSCIRTQASRIVFGQNKLILYELMHLNVQQLI